MVEQCKSVRPPSAFQLFIESCAMGNRQSSLTVPVTKTSQVSLNNGPWFGHRSVVPWSEMRQIPSSGNDKLLIAWAFSKVCWRNLLVGSRIRTVLQYYSISCWCQHGNCFSGSEWPSRVRRRPLVWSKVHTCTVSCTRTTPFSHILTTLINIRSVLQVKNSSGKRQWIQGNIKVRHTKYRSGDACYFSAGHRRAEDWWLHSLKIVSWLLIVRASHLVQELTRSHA
jgi:hypothetical protein